MHSPDSAAEVRLKKNRPLHGVPEAESQHFLFSLGLIVIVLKYRLLI